MNEINKNTELGQEDILDTNEVLEESDMDIELEETEYEDVSQNDKLKKLRNELKEARSQSQEYLTGWQKERADFSNYKSNEEKLRKERVSGLKLSLVSDFFPVLDSFDMAFSNKEAWEKVDPAWRVGVEYIYTQFLNTLENYNVTLINQNNIEFNPEIHETVEHIEVSDEQDNNKIITVIQKGYKSGDIVLRPAKVKVGKYEN